mmetsp:Transcript_2998/g.8770  ORF Transcript_2998/g.8770 Transcript_2998/m.8770 type:complete len:175 (-) Transcript_2998:265-789(-)
MPASLLLWLPPVSAVLFTPASQMPTPASRLAVRAPAATMADKVFKLGELELGAGKANVAFKPLMDSSEAVVVRYKLPFGLNAEEQAGRVVVTQDGAGGERVGDVLRFTTRWSLGLPQGGGLVSTAASFGGAIGWQLSLFDVAKARNFDEVVEALTSNTEDRTNQVTLIFERPTA